MDGAAETPLADLVRSALAHMETGNWSMLLRETHALGASQSNPPAVAKEIARLASQIASLKCAAHQCRFTGPHDPQECDWPVCGCDPYADKVIAALQESGLLKERPKPEPTVTGWASGAAALEAAAAPTESAP